MRSVFLNDQPYVDGQEDPHQALGDTLAFSVDDWAATRAMAWTWGIVNGWDDDAMAELAQQFGWDEATTARLNRLHAAFDAASPSGAEERLRAALEQGPPFRGRTYDWMSPQEGHALGWSEAMAHVRSAFSGGSVDEEGGNG